MNDTLHNVARWADRGDRIAIAMVVGAMRSAPRPLGTKMAINDRGEISGSVSGGCGEGAVVEIAERVISSGHPGPLCPVWLTTDQERRGGDRTRRSPAAPALCCLATEELAAMNPFDATYVAGPLSERRSRLDVDEPGALHSAITPGPDLLVQHLRPIVADLVGSGRMGLGTLLAPADPMVIIDGFCYRSDAGMSVCRVSPFEPVRCATVVDFRHGSQFRIEYPVPRADVASLAAQVFGALPEIVAVELSGTFSGVTVPNGTFGRADGRAVGFVTRTSPGRDWHLSFLTADRTFGGPILEISIENVELKIVAPRVVYQAPTGEQASTSPATAGSGC
jgi:alpha-acetolactate decarboxylase